eukprot:403342863
MDQLQQNKSQASSAKTQQMISLDLREQVRCIQVAPNRKSFIVGGRNLLKLISVDDEMKMKIEKNMHLNKRNLDTGAQYIAWNKKNESLVLTCSANNGIALWNIESGQNLIKLYKEHTKAVKLSWDPFNANQFISGSQDTLIKLWDTSIEKSVHTMQRMRSRDDQVNQVQFNPKRQYQFAAAQGDGTIDLWDLRKTNAPFFSFLSHLKPTYCLDWHPDLEDILMSGSGDKYAKIWYLKEGETRQLQQNAMYQIQTPQSINKCQWVPGKNFQIATLSNNSADLASVNVWHCQKPYLQQYIYRCQKESILDFEWLIPNEYLLTANQYMVNIQPINTAIRPYERLCTTAINFNINNELAINLDEVLLETQQKAQNTRQKKMALTGQNKPSKSNKSEMGDFKKINKFDDLKIFSLQNDRPLHMQENTSLSDDPFTYFENLSIEYKFRYITCQSNNEHHSHNTTPSQELEAICLNNARVASSYGLYDVALTWNSLKDLAKELICINSSTIVSNKKGLNPACNQQQIHQKHTNEDKRNLQNLDNNDELQDQDQQINKKKNKKKKNRQHLQQEFMDTDELQDQQTESQNLGFKVFENDNLEVQVFDELSQINDDSNTTQANSDQVSQKPLLLDFNAISKALALPDSANLKMRRQSSASSKKNNHSRSKSREQSMASGPIYSHNGHHHHYQQNQKQQNGLQIGESDMKFQVVFGFQSQRQVPLNELLEQQATKKKNLMKNHKSVQPSQGQKKQQVMQTWIQDLVQKTVIDAIETYSNNGDIQTAAFIALVFFSHLNQDTYKNFLIRVVVSYFLLLRDLSYYTQSAEILKYGPNLGKISEITQNEKSNLISIMCQFCETSEEQGNSLTCTKCNRIFSRCAVCHQPVKTLYLWCQGCSHGGHFNHMLKWLKSNKTCPAGCGHICKY